MKNCSACGCRGAFRGRRCRDGAGGRCMSVRRAGEPDQPVFEQAPGHHRTPGRQDDNRASSLQPEVLEKPVGSAIFFSWRSSQT